MSADVIQFVDSIDASPTVLLDVNLDLNPWICRLITANPPRLRRAMSTNAMTDGGDVSSSQYDMRTVVLDLEVRDSNQDDGAAQLQALARVLDRADLFLKWHINGASKPVFFKLFRSDMPAIREIQQAAASYRAVQVELLAEPFALGLRETLGPFTVNNDPAAGSGALYFELSSSAVLGDVPAPFVAWGLNYVNKAWLSARYDGEALGTDLQFIQAESATLGTDTTNPGGGPDADMSGAGTNNYVETSFATPTLATRLTWPAPAKRGRWRLLAAIRPSSGTDTTFQIKAAANGNGMWAEAPTIGITLTSTIRQLVDLGLISINEETLKTAGYSTAENTAASIVADLQIKAARTTGTRTLQWDYLVLSPADEGTLSFTYSVTTSAGIAAIDGVRQQVYTVTSSSDPIAGSATGSAAGSYLPAGSFLYVVPAMVNRFYFVKQGASGSFVHDKTSVSSISLGYWPRYLNVRPSAS